MPTDSPKRTRLTSTRTLLHRVRGGDARAREELVSRFLPSLKRWASGRLPEKSRSLSDTDDLVQVSLMRALDRAPDFESRGQGAFLGYLHRILLNAIRDEIRRTAVRPEETLDENLPEDRPALLDRTIGPDAVEAYEKALATLPERQQQAVVLRIEFGFSFPEIATLLGNTKPDAVRMLVTRGLVLLAERMAGPSVSFEER
ncbi:MAG: sigma-70 family RNA polymerase sigma factor [Candidatus Eisenbacteria bacterium]|uniref:Sigma-70 family RNA polymerase sigma factor n=1 Tax=Eiseniibacteriota bacterium TaxID=2212470 RepID=A0A956RNH6_UNCEI|nr:sigma-70 family RNA polymerase sigma factor [Candidatus Eisenbacteria bacterium]